MLINFIYLVLIKNLKTVFFSLVDSPLSLDSCP